MTATWILRWTKPRQAITLDEERLYRKVTDDLGNELRVVMSLFEAEKE